MLNSKIPAGNLEKKWEDYKGHCKLVNPANKRKLEVIVVGTGLKHFVFRTHLAVRTLLQHKVVSTLLKTIRTMVIAYLDYSTIPLKVVTTVHVKQTFTV
jgi:hypothetical protein